MEGSHCLRKRARYWDNLSAIPAAKRYWGQASYVVAKVVSCLSLFIEMPCHLLYWTQRIGRDKAGTTQFIRNQADHRTNLHMVRVTPGKVVERKGCHRGWDRTAL
jgi:hypothetical protein